MKYIVLFGLLLGTAFSTFAQDEGRIALDRDTPLRERLYVGGGLGASFSGYVINVEISPLIGYMLTDRWSAGVGGSYIYYQNKVYGFSQNIVGARTFTRYQLLNFLFAHGEYEHLFMKVRDNVTNDYYNTQVPGLLAGLGLSSYMGERSMFYAMILYNFLDRPDRSPYSSPYVIRVGFNFGL